jgi:PAS domain S-box-containing protein
LFNSTCDAILVLDPFSAKFLSGNASAVRLFRAKDEQDLLSRSAWDYSPERQPDGLLSREKVLEMVESAKRAGYHSFEWTHRRIDGTIFHADVLLTSVATGEEAQLYATVRDITERKQAEAKLRLQGAALDAAANAIVITDHRGTIQWANPAFTQLTGYTLEEAVGQNSRMLKSGMQDELFYRNLWKAIFAGSVWSGEITNRRKDGQLYSEEMTIAPVRSATGEITNFVAIKQDFTQRKRAEEALETSTAKYRDLFESTRDAIVILEPCSRKIVTWNPSATRLFGGKGEESSIFGTLSDVSPTRQPDGSTSTAKARIDRNNPEIWLAAR